MRMRSRLIVGVIIPKLAPQKLAAMSAAIISLSLLVSCSSTPKASRSPASRIHPFAYFRARFLGEQKQPQTSAGVPSARMRLMLAVSRYVALDRLGDRYLAEFDELVKNDKLPQDLYTSEPYANLMAIRMEKDAEEAKALASYVELADDAVAHENEKAAPESQTAQLQLAQTQRTSSGSLEHLTEQFEAIRRSAWNEATDSNPRVPIDQALPSIEDMRSKETGTREPNSLPSDMKLDQATLRRLSRLASSVRKTLIAAYNDSQVARSPQSAGGPEFYPSEGPHGNIWGPELPLGKWALTLDDGPSLSLTPGLLETLDEHRIHATFFQLAHFFEPVKPSRFKRSSGNSPLVRKSDEEFAKDVKKAESEAQANIDLSLNIASRGHVLANHSFDHRSLTLAGTDLKLEIDHATEVEASVWGSRPQFYRCPYGAGVRTPAIRKRIAEQGMIHVFWTSDTLDWQDKNPDSIVERSLRIMKNCERHGTGGVFLFHDIHSQSTKAIRILLRRLEGQGIQWLTLPEVLAIPGIHAGNR